MKFLVGLAVVFAALAGLWFGLIARDAKATLMDGGPTPEGVTGEERGTTERVGVHSPSNDPDAARRREAAGAATADERGRKGVVETALSVHESIEAGGRILAWDESSAALGATVAVRRFVEGRWETEREAAVDATGVWGPVPIAVAGEERVGFELSGGTLVTTLEVREVGIGDGPLRVDFAGAHGHDVWFVPVDEQGNDVEGGEATVRWRQDGEELEARGKAEDGAYICVRGVPPATVETRVECPGYVAQAGPVTRVPADPPTTHVVVMRRSGGLGGRVTHRDMPVRDFVVVVCQGEFEQEEAFRSEDGTFELMAAPAGAVRVYATSESILSTHVVPVVVTAGERAVVELDFPDPLQARGRVVDGLAGRPVEGAVVQLQSVGDTILRDWGSGVSTGADGTFELSGVVPGMLRFAVSAAGFSRRYQSRSVDVSSERVELGDVALFRAQPIVVRLEGPADLEPSRYRLSIGAGRWPAQMPFSPSGEVRLGAADAGTYLFDLYEDGRLVQTRTVELREGPDWEIVFWVGGGCSVVAELEGEPEAHRGWSVSLQVPMPTNSTLSGFVRPVGVDGVATFTGLPAGPFFANALGPGGAIRASAVDAVAEGETAIVRLEPEAPLRRVRVVRPDRSPVSGAHLSLYLAEDLPVGASAKCAADGTCAVSFSAPEAVAVAYAQGGVSAPERIRFASDAEFVHEVIFDPGARIAATLLTPQGPAQGVQTILHEHPGFFALAAVSSDVSGRVVFESLGARRYYVGVRDPRYWAVDVAMDAKPRGAPVAIRLHRLGGLGWDVRDANGRALAGVLVRLESAEFDERVEDWLRAGRIGSSTGGLHTGADGSLVLNGLPEGDYEWSVDGAGGVRAGGTVTVTPRMTEAVRVVLR